MANLKISTRLIAAFSMLVAVLGVISAIIYADVLSMSAAVQGGERASLRRVLIDRTLAAQVEEQNAARGYLLAPHPSFMTTIDEQKAVIADTLQKLEETSRTDQERAHVAELRPLANRALAELDQLVADSNDPAKLARARAESRLTGRLTDSRAVIGKMRLAADAVVGESTLAREQAMTSLGRLTVMAGLCAIAIAAAAAFVLQRSIARPISKVAEVMTSLANGSYEGAIPGVHRRDEIGDMARALQVFNKAVQEKLQLERNEELRQEAEELRQRTEAERAEAAARQAAVIETLGDALVALEQGDLTHRVRGLPSVFARLEGNFNAAMDKLETALRGVMSSSETIHGNSAEVANVSGDIATRAEQQAASLEQTAVALAEITTTLKITADSAEKANSLTGAARGEVEVSRTVLDKTVDAIQRIATSSDKISTIIGVIDEIAFQTNLLALNAGVEAARAGEAGRGFAVVAQEVRALAQRSAEAAKEIKDLIGTAQTDVADGVTLIGQTGDVMSRILNQVSAVDGVVQGIARSVREQSTGLQEIDTAVRQMDRVTQQNAAVVEEASTVSKQLYAEVDNLAGLVRRFRTSGQSAAPRGSRLAA